MDWELESLHLVRHAVEQRDSGLHILNDVLLTDRYKSRFEKEYHLIEGQTVEEVYLSWRQHAAILAAQVKTIGYTKLLATYYYGPKVKGDPLPFLSQAECALRKLSSREHDEIKITRTTVRDDTALVESCWNCGLLKGVKYETSFERRSLDGTNFWVPTRHRLTAGS